MILDRRFAGLAGLVPFLEGEEEGIGSARTRCTIFSVHFVSRAIIFGMVALDAVWISEWAALNSANTLKAVVWTVVHPLDPHES